MCCTRGVTRKRLVVLPKQRLEDKGSAQPGRPEAEESRKQQRQLQKADPSRRIRRPQKPGLTANKNERIFVKHNYHDHANDSDPEDEDTAPPPRVASGGGKGAVTSSLYCAASDISFPLKLHHLLDRSEEDGLGHVASWAPHGRAFLIHQPKEFVDKILPNYFRQSKLTSFQRQLNLYGFQRVTRGPDSKAYYHELFLRGKPLLTKKMVRVRIKGTKYKAASSPDSEPDFYKMPPMATTGGKAVVATGGGSGPASSSLGPAEKKANHHKNDASAVIPSSPHRKRDISFKIAASPASLLKSTGGSSSIKCLPWNKDASIASAAKRAAFSTPRDNGASKCSRWNKEVPIAPAAKPAAPLDAARSSSCSNGRNEGEASSLLAKNPLPPPLKVISVPSGQKSISRGHANENRIIRNAESGSSAAASVRWLSPAPAMLVSPDDSPRGSLSYEDASAYFPAPPPLRRSEPPQHANVFQRDFSPPLVDHHRHFDAFNPPLGFGRFIHAPVPCELASVCHYDSPVRSTMEKKFPDQQWLGGRDFPMSPLPVSSQANVRLSSAVSENPPNSNSSTTSSSSCGGEQWSGSAATLTSESSWMDDQDQAKVNKEEDRDEAIIERIADEIFGPPVPEPTTQKQGSPQELPLPPSSIAPLPLRRCERRGKCAEELVEVEMKEETEVADADALLLSFARDWVPPEQADSLSRVSSSSSAIFEKSVAACLDQGCHGIEDDVDLGRLLEELADDL
uniref:HSF-type DNA-binding domain-containing protein n=1 Tax=Pseudictyota dubia TaxID=2749911 RepID=A0A7R9WKV0_9STRA|mmetsp:Transcript_7859/g.14250  ORF Transcript_7859/g.14250 Transcript_7859/m.14250 type:complete len:738 (+) Transcript_7859:296-2509(+)|eukprot:CAMPEP_0197438218 /NCGR_PEP_ID=MMETSP1175-20131217/5271_1 /TAXON_ID=1003142 /ORGANISM="Triceratium dubium, Strain CCMP147" /LENGTH=737 /DNA_ID=CAMNT_0042967901 /DNA_START=294 /DNA_END=2507 /DNA_ORIENTATION=-